MLSSRFSFVFPLYPSLHYPRHTAELSAKKNQPKPLILSNCVTAKYAPWLCSMVAGISQKGVLPDPRAAFFAISEVYLGKATL